MPARPSPISADHGPVWIIGASSGLGYAVAQQLLAEGREVIVSARHYDRLRNFMGQKGAHVMPMDISNRDTLRHALTFIERHHGTPAVVIVCAGQFQPEPDGLVNASTLQELWEVNVLGVQHVLDAVRPRMAWAGRGQVVVLGSLVGYIPTPTSAAYGATKAALMHLLAGQHAAWWNQGLLLQLATPGFIDTPMIAHGRYPALFCLSARQAARRLLKAMQSTRFELTFPRRAAVLARFSTWLPWAWRLRHLTHWLEQRNARTKSR